MGKSGSCNNLIATCSFLMKLAILINSKVKIMHIFLICLLNINFGCYGNLKLPLVLYWENADPAITSKIYVVFS